MNGAHGLDQGSNAPYTHAVSLPRRTAVPGALVRDESRGGKREPILSRRCRPTRTEGLLAPPPRVARAGVQSAARLSLVARA
jgi:hypothetical protein